MLRELVCLMLFWFYNRLRDSFIVIIHQRGWVGRR
jgi:hypothetical protein